MARQDGQEPWLLAARFLNRLAIDHVVYAPLGVTLQHHAWRKNVSGIVQAPLPLFWG
jgi:peptide/nickel transport system substrate-binding protein